MGRLNKKLLKSPGSKPPSSSGLSSLKLSSAKLQGARDALTSAAARGGGAGASDKTPGQDKLLFLVRPGTAENKAQTNSPSATSDPPCRRRLRPGAAEGKVTKKKDRRLAKAAALRKRLAQQASTLSEAKSRAKREKTAVVGDLKPMADTLDVIDQLLKSDQGARATKDARKKSKPRNAMKSAKRQAEMMRDLSVFSQVRRHPEYVKDPFKTISTHIENKMLLEAMRAGQQ